ncbi:hypothetical protein DKP76_07090 [Falsochrobactrum shanghaiense]|uniref:Tape measure protein N-terminal domain-containing protein n=1 Tax=Falsochrobactrum shanghaiense TaxID=2201899 RepID=A0A316JAC1_9HYPH|nr:tape measure protein [Falsochrobactrum shanghaiense]PWL18822.1 hypothetical protein DKP76_07090 [Falsochrobactrum shanghaiense]
MAVTVEELRATLRMEMKPFMRDLQQMNGVSAKAARQVEGTWRAANKRLDGIGRNMARSLIAPMAGIGAVLGADQIRQMTDTWTDLNSRVALAAGGLDKGAEVMGRLGEVARRTYSSLEQTAEGYLLNATAMKELGYSTNQTLDYTESVNNALVISGAKGQRAEAVMNALSKAMAGGKLSGDNLNTVIEQGGRLAEALAEGLGVGVNQLRALGQQGKITGRDIVRSLSSQMEVLRKEAADMPATIGDGFTLLNNAMLEYVGNADQATGVSAKISEALVIMADNFDKTADVALQLAGVIAGALIGRSLLKMISTLGLAGPALINFTRALTAARTMAGLATAFTGLGAAAGPVGLLIGGAVVSSLMLYSSATAEASEGARRFAERLEDIEGRAEKSAEKVEAAGQRYNEALKNALGHESSAAEQEFEDAHAAALKLLDAAIEVAPALKIVTDEAGNMSRQPMASQDQMDDLNRLRDELAKNANGAEEAKNELYALANANPNFQALADQLAPLLDRLALVAQGFREVRAEVAATSGDGLGSSSFSRGGRTRARQELIEERQLNDEYVNNAKQRASLGKAQYDLESKIAQVRAQAEKDGRKLTDAQIKEIAQAQLAGDAARSAEGRKPKAERDNDYERLTKSIADRTAAILAETEALRQLDPTIDDYGFALEKARAEQELLNAAQKAGLEITPALKKEINQAAEQFALATVEANQLAEAQDKIRQRAEEWQDTQKDALRGIVDDLVAGKSAAEAFAGALQKIADKLLDMAFDDLFSGMFKSGGGGGIFGSIGSIFGFDKGGYTGHGGKYEPAGVVHKGEYVFDQDAVKKAGGPAALDAMRRGLKGYAAGGYVGASLPSVPTMPRLQAPTNSNTQSITFAPVIDARGADSAAVARLEQVVARQQAEFSYRVVEAVRNANSTRVKFGRFN